MPPSLRPSGFAVASRRPSRKILSRQALAFPFEVVSISECGARHATETISPGEIVSVGARHRCQNGPKGPRGSLELPVIPTEGLRGPSGGIPTGKARACREGIPPLARGALGRDDREGSLEFVSITECGARHRCCLVSPRVGRMQQAPGDGSDLVEELPCLLSFPSGDGASDLQDPQVAIHLFG